MQENNNGIAFTVAGIITTLVGFVWMNAAGLGGILIAPIVYFVGPGLFIVGLGKIFKDKSTSSENTAIVGALLVATVVIIAVIVLFVEIREDQCLEQHGTSYQYETCKSKLF